MLIANNNGGISLDDVIGIMNNVISSIVTSSKSNYDVTNFDLALNANMTSSTLTFNLTRNKMSLIPGSIKRSRNDPK